MRIIVGLGNYESKYLMTYHNVGFMAADLLAERLNKKFDKRICRAVCSEFQFKGEKLIIAKPLTFMNLSGECVKELLKNYKAEPSSLTVVYDDIDLSKGSVRIRKSGGPGTHNGMRNIVENLGGETGFSRIRVGIGPKPESTELYQYVLSEISETDESMKSGIKTAADALSDIISGVPMDIVMNRRNR